MKQLSRRTVLRGAGATLALPWLEAMGWASNHDRKAEVAAPVRMAVLFMPNGVHPDQWTPKGEGKNFKLSPSLEPLEDLRREIVVLTNLWNQSAKGPEGHYRKVAALLTSTTITKTLGLDVNCNGVSMDQVAAQRAGEKTPLPSMELAVAPLSTGVDRNVGYTRLYGSHIAWSGPTTPLPREINPKLAFERLLRASQPSADVAKRDKLLLDQVLDDANKLRGELGGADRMRMDEYLSGVRALEARIERASHPNENPWKPRTPLDPASKPVGIPDEHAEHVRLMLDVIALAFQSDSTRIATFLFGNSVSNQNFAFLDGVDSAHHSLSHHQNEEDKMRQYQLINRWHVEQYAYLLRKVQAMPEGEGSVLDNSMLLFASGLRDGNKHDPHNLPLVLGGRGGGRIAAGRHLVSCEDTPLANLYLSMLDAFGTPLDRFADSTGRLNGVLA